MMYIQPTITATVLNYGAVLVRLKGVSYGHQYIGCSFGRLFSNSKLQVNDFTSYLLVSRPRRDLEVQRSQYRDWTFTSPDLMVL
jgi:hypothetical protein